MPWLQSPDPPAATHAVRSLDAGRERRTFPLYEKRSINRPTTPAANPLLLARRRLGVDRLRPQGIPVPSAFVLKSVRHRGACFSARSHRAPTGEPGRLC